MVSGTTQKTEDFEVRKNWVLGCGDLLVQSPVCFSWYKLLFENVDAPL